MKKIILLLFVILLISGMINAKIFYLELRTNFFNPANRDFKDIYKKVNIGGTGASIGLKYKF